MTDIERQIEELTSQLAEMRSRQLLMSKDLVRVERQLETLKASLSLQTDEVYEPKEIINPEPVTARQEVPYILQAKQNIQQKSAPAKKPLQVTQGMEDFIGTNVISKIGILVTIIGVFIGAKYAIDNELISPLMRILAGYAAAGVLVLLAFRLKKKYEYFSSVLIGGGLSVTYFITYIAYSFYQLFPLSIAFILMVITTSAAVAIAIWYNQKIIALLGQVAAYAIPFLLGNGNGNIFILFSYITVINLGLLFLSFKKDWKLLYHIAFFLTWLIYVLSTISGNKVTGNFTAGLTFLSVNFFTFYITFLSYKIVKRELYQVREVAVLLLNALVFFFLGTYIVNENFQSQHFLTWFTIGNACVHLAAGYVIYKLHLADKSVFQFILGLGLLFFTIAIPIELDGNWVTLLWTFEATALFYVAFNTRRELYLDIALPLVVISFISLLQDWFGAYPFMHNAGIAVNLTTTPFANLNFILSLCAIACFGTMSFFIRKFDSKPNTLTGDFFCKVLPVAFLVILYFAFYNEIHFAWDETISTYPVNSNFVKSDELLRSVTLIIFSFVYLASWLFINTNVLRSGKLHHLLLAFAFIVSVVFLLSGLYNIGVLRELYISKAANQPSEMLLFIRYFSFAALVIFWLSIWNALKTFKPRAGLQKVVSGVFNLTLLSVISNEFIHWMDLSGYHNQYKLGLSLICGGYALTLLFTGIIKNKKHLRISAMVLFAGTLLKLFFYDLASLSTISKTIVLVLLGVLLLFASFLYNKYKDLLFPKEENSVE